MLEDVACPACGENTGQSTEREALNCGLLVSYECEQCGHVWDVVF